MMASSLHHKESLSVEEFLDWPSVFDSLHTQTHGAVLIPKKYGSFGGFLCLFLSLPDWWDYSPMIPEWSTTRWPQWSLIFISSSALSVETKTCSFSLDSGSPTEMHPLKTFILISVDICNILF